LATDSLATPLGLPAGADGAAAAIWAVSLLELDELESEPLAALAIP
jgi:hypothetical protein